MRRARSAGSSVFLWIAALAAVVACPLWAQVKEDEETPSEPVTIPRISGPAVTGEKPLAAPRIDIDLFTFLSSKDAQADTATDQVWTVKAAPGKRLFQLPI